MDDAVLGSSGEESGRGGTVRAGDERNAGRGRRAGGAAWRRIATLTVVVLIATLCPMVPGTPAGAATGSVEQLPDNFQPALLNNNGDVAGLIFDGGLARAAMWSGGQLIEMGGPASRVHDFNDAGQMLVQGSPDGTVMQVRGPGTSRTLAKPIVGGRERAVSTGWGPDVNDRIVARFGYISDPESSSVQYLGASPPNLITDIATVWAVNKAGQIFGQLPGKTLAFAVKDGSTISPVSGLAAPFVFPVDWSDGGHLLYTANGTYYVWKDGVSTEVGPGARRVNSKGVVLGSSVANGAVQAELRFENGQRAALTTLAELPADVTSFFDIKDINDQCDVIARGRTTDNRTPWFVVKSLDCEPIDIDGSFFRVDNGPPAVKKDEESQVRLRIANQSGTELTGVQLLSVEAKDDGSGGAAIIEQSGEGPPGVLAATGLESQGFVDFTVTGEEAGTVILTAEVSANKEGEIVTATIESEFTVRAEDLVVNLTLDPPEYEVPEDGEFEPVDITATVSFTNATDEDMSNIRLQDLDVARVFSGQELYVTYTSGIRPDPLDPEVIVTELKAGQTSAEFTAVFTATDSGEVEFSALATAKLGENGAATGLKKVRWKAKVQKFVEITTEVVPPNGDLHPAGSPVTINGTVENLSNAHEVTLGPLYPVLEGNTGTMNVGYDGNAPNPTAPVAAEPLVLEPGQKRTFQVRFTTNYSDPRMYEAQPSGGTRAYARFEPWGQAVEVRDPDDGEPEVVPIRTYDEETPPTGSTVGPEPDAQVKATPEALFHRISIDDSIEIPERPTAAVAAGIMVGAVEGLANAAIAAIYAIPDLIKMPYTVLVAAYDYQAKVWESFTEEEKELFLTETSFLIVSVLQRNVEFGLKDSQELYDQVYEMAGDHLTETQNEWQTGDFLETTRGYSAFMSETIGSVAGPVILTKMAQSPKAVAALERFQTAINARMAATFASARNVKYVDNVLPILQSIENGAEPTLTAIAKLWGVTPEEIAEYQRICKIIGCLANIRSRHASSVEWIKKFGALLKPENLKIKTVNELDVMLGYNFDDLGSVIFRKPEILKTLGSGATKDQIKAEARKFATSKGFTPETKEFNEAVTRLEDRAGEWNKYQKTYQQWNDRGWIDTSFNYEGNAIPEYRFDADGNVIGKLTGADKGNFKGFRMVEKSPGSDEFIVQMLDGKSGKWRRVTGDIDPVDFTYTDGSPLSPEDHARLISLLQNSPIGAEHGYTSTFLGFKDPKTGAVIVKPGPELVKKQFKPNEPALQIAPEGAPRATRIDVENSRWVDPYNYNIRWVNGFVDMGTGRGRGPAGTVDSNFDVIPLDAPAQIALPVKAKPTEPTVGRFIVQHGDQGGTAALLMGENGLLQTIAPDGATQDSPLHQEAFEEGATQTITVAPASQLTEPGPDAAPLRRGAAVRTQTPDTPSLDAGSTLIEVSTDEGLAGTTEGFAAGQTLAVGAGTEDMELVEVASVTGGKLELVEPLEFDHRSGDVVVMVVSADGVPVDPDKGVDPAPPPGPGETTTTTTPGPAGGGDGDPSGAGGETGETGEAEVLAATPASAAGTAGNDAAASGSNAGSASGGGASLALTGAGVFLLLLAAFALLTMGLGLGRVGDAAGSAGRRPRR